MTGTAHAGVGVLAVVFVYAVLLIRWAVTPAPDRTRIPRPVEVWEPAYLWIPAQHLDVPCQHCGTPITITTTTGAHR